MSMQSQKKNMKTIHWILTKNKPMQSLQDILRFHLG